MEINKIIYGPIRDRNIRESTFHNYDYNNYNHIHDNWNVIYIAVIVDGILFNVKKTAPPHISYDQLIKDCKREISEMIMDKIFKDLH